MIIKLDKSRKEELAKISTFVCSIIKSSNKKFNGNLDDLHMFESKSNINKLRLKIFNEINSKYNWENFILKICGNEIKEIHGQDLLIQSKINLSIQIPNDETSVLPKHTDCNSADSPFQSNVWIPLTNAFDTNSMFLFDKKRSLKYFQSINKIKKVTNKNIFSRVLKKDFIKIDYGQCLLFNPAQLHGNQVNKTNKTRVSLNVRIKSLFSPEPTDRNPDRKLGTYYKPLQISNDSKYAIKLIKMKFFE